MSDEDKTTDNQFSEAGGVRGALMHAAVTADLVASMVDRNIPMMVAILIFSGCFVSARTKRPEVTGDMIKKGLIQLIDIYDEMEREVGITQQIADAAKKMDEDLSKIGASDIGSLIGELMKDKRTIN